ncbi:NIPSNAP family protein [Rhodobacteraceae bacterium W635]|uniref:NIPSNAP family protein n=1 Tax=Nioella halotolerans TaxID=2303578 RepID=UPI000E3C657A|nr:NIPSNAP family protein [Rhodobacteraceae bacterium W635]
MIVEERIYTFHPGKLPQFMEEYEAVRELQSRTLGQLLGYFTSEFGLQNQTVHLWGYDSLEDRNARRAKLAALPEWRAFLGRILPLLDRQENRILTPLSFSPLGNPK